MNNHKQNNLTLIIALLATTLLIGCQQTPQDVTIGFIMPLSGELSTFGEAALEGAQLYADQHPGIRIVTEDEKGDSKTAITAYHKLYEVDGVRRFLGPFGPVNSQALYASLSSHQKIDSTIMGFTLCFDEFSNYTNLQCTYPSIPFQIGKSLDYLASRGHAHLYVITEDSLMGQLATQTVENSTDRLNFSRIEIDRINLDQREFLTEVTKAVASTPDAILILTGRPDPSATIARQLKDAGYIGEVYLAAEVSSESLNKYGDSLEGNYFRGYAKIEPESSFRDAFVSRYGKEPDIYSIHGYLLAQILAESGSEEDIIDIQDVMRYIDSHPQTLAWSGYRINADRSVETPLKMMQVLNGTLVEVWSTA